MRSLPNLTSCRTQDNYLEPSDTQEDEDHHQEEQQHHHYHHHYHHYNHHLRHSRLSNSNRRTSMRHTSRNSLDQLRRSRSLQMLQAAIRRSVKLVTLPKIRDINIVDRYSRVVFPIAFIIFNAFYWSFYFI